MKNALLYATHMWSAGIAAEFAKLQTLKGFDSWLLIDAGSPDLISATKTYPRCHSFTSAILLELPYKTLPQLRSELPRGHAHFPMLHFYHSWPTYDYYWFIEYDVRYTGRWRSLFERFSRFDSDLITTHVRYFAEEPWWLWWNTFGHPSKTIPKEKLIRSFNIFYRISNKALRFLDSILREGWSGHHEVLIATLLHFNGFAVLDFGGSGSFVSPEHRNATYISASSRDGSLVGESNGSTIRWRPSMDEPGGLRNKLYHPIKT